MFDVICRVFRGFTVALALAAGFLLPAHAANLLVNPSFEANSGHTIPTGWTRFAPPTAQGPIGNFWVENGGITQEDGLQHFKEWGASYNGTNNAAGIYQDLSSSPGSTYQASGWLYTRGSDVLGADCYVWLQVEFLDSHTNLLALYKSDNFTASVGTDNWFQYQVTNACNPSAPVSIGDPFFNTYAKTGTVSQLVAPAGTVTVRYRFVYVQIGNEGGSAYLDATALNQVSGAAPPTINNILPLNEIFVDPHAGVSFNVNSPSGFTINTNSIGLVLNGVNVSSGLSFSGSSSNKNVTYSGLASNTVYNATITVTDSFNLTATASTYFETTWVGVPPVLRIWEAEDFDFTNGMFYDFPTLCDTVGNPNCYFGTVGVSGVDEYYTANASTLLYRPADLVGTLISGDYSRQDHVLAGVYDYRIDPFNTSSWLNYTRNWSNSTYWVIGRLSTDVGLNGSLTLSLVNPDTTLTQLGVFTINGGKGWSTFQNVYLKDTNGNNALVTLNGKQTLQLTSGGNLLPNFFMLVAAQADLPILSNMYPTGNRPFEYTNKFSFTATAFGNSFPTNGIHVNIDGTDVSSNLVITGSASTLNVVYPSLMPNAIHTAVLAITNSLGHGILVTNNFDTFSETNFMVEAEDFDYSGGQFIPNWFPDAYADYNGPYPAETNIDFHHTPLDGEVYNYRAVGIPQDVLGSHDYLRQDFVDVGGVDYVLVFFAGNDWANYTRAYPAGSYYAYIRTSGGGPFSMYLDQVVSGAGTLNQGTQRLGTFSGNGKDYNTFAWVPLTDSSLSAPSVVTLNGQATLRLSTSGDCNPNFFMLVPAAGIRVHASFSFASGNTTISFPSQAGVNYRVFYRTNLASGGWTLLSSVTGTGSTVSVTDPTPAAGRFYKVTAP